ncbi:MAG: rhodanese-like domain-containing protein [Casimicrobiaceae bacterium]
MTVAFLTKNWILILTFVASGGMLLWPLVSRRLSSVRDINTLAATQLINAGNPLLLDLREPKEYDGRTLPNAVHVPLSQLGNRGGELAKYVSRPVIAFCERGQRSRSAASTLTKQGFKEIYCLSGGFKGWRDAGLPVTKP